MPAYNFLDVPDTIAHWVTAGQLKELLATLRDDDVLSPNMVGNLSIVRGEDFIGWVDLLGGNCRITMRDEG